MSDGRENTVRAGDLPTAGAECESYHETPEWVMRDLERRFPVGTVAHHTETMALHVVVWHLTRDIVPDGFHDRHEVPEWCPATETVRVVDLADADLSIFDASVQDLRECDSLETNILPFPGSLFEMDADVRVPHYREGDS